MTYEPATPPYEFPIVTPFREDVLILHLESVDTLLNITYACTCRSLTYTIIQTRLRASFQVRIWALLESKWHQELSG